MSTLSRNGALGAMLALLVGSSHASSVVLLSEPELIDTADLIVHGVVLESQAAFQSGPVRIFTAVQIEVTEVLKGTWSEDTIDLVLPGGSDGETTISVAGAPRFLPGEEVCVFLRALEDGRRTTVGLSYGKYRIEEDPRTALPQAVHAGAVMNQVALSRPNQTTRQAQAGVAPALTPWDSFRQRILHRTGGGRR